MHHPCKMDYTGPNPVVGSKARHTHGWIIRRPHGQDETQFRGEVYARLMPDTTTENTIVIVSRNGFTYYEDNGEGGSTTTVTFGTADDER